ncbi:hypothetical protein GCM10023231_21240 [Olivibacter ginsenosidimutans]|uniref:histidine kinase n=1 Tax=Olivibacter ginsenosidimutans TaxID=1176537 RepID=A0ABP9BAP9_9SPHI
MFRAPSIAIIIVDKSFIIQDFNLSAKRFNELKDYLVVGNNLLNLFPPILNEGYGIIKQGLALTKDTEGSYYAEQIKKWVYITFQHTTSGYTICLHNMEGLKETVTLHSILNAQEEERIRIAEILHNEVGQLLAITHLQIDHNTLAQTKKLLKEAIKRVRTIAFELTPTILQDLGLEGALKDMVNKKLEAQNISCTIQTAIPGGTLGRYMDIIIFRILQELLNNIVKHAHASAVTINLLKQSNGIFLSILDNGKGINLAKYQAEQNPGFGLKSINKRIQLLDGIFTIAPQEGKGTKAEIFVPLRDTEVFNLVF